MHWCTTALFRLLLINNDKNLKILFNILIFLYINNFKVAKLQYLLQSDKSNIYLLLKLEKVWS